MKENFDYVTALIIAAKEKNVAYASELLEDLHYNSDQSGTDVGYQISQRADTQTKKWVAEIALSVDQEMDKDYSTDPGDLATELLDLE